MAEDLKKIYVEKKECLKTVKEFAVEVKSLNAKKEGLREENEKLHKTITILGEEKEQQKVELSDKIEKIQSSVIVLEDEKMQQKEDLSEKIEVLQRNVKSLEEEKMQK